MSKSLNPTQTRYPIFDKGLYSCFMAVKYFSAEISGQQVTMCNDHYALVQQYNRPEPVQSIIANKQRRMRMMGELSYRGVKLVHTPGRVNPLADFLSHMNQDQNCPIFQKMQRQLHQLQETQTAGTLRTEHSHEIVNNFAQRQRAANADNWSVNIATSATDHQSDSDWGVRWVDFSKSNKAATALAKCDLKHCNAPLAKTAANTPLPHKAAIVCQHFNALPFCHAKNSTQRKSTFPSKETWHNVLIGYTLSHDHNILTSRRLQLEHFAQPQAKSMHELEELSHVIRAGSDNVCLAPSLGTTRPRVPAVRSVNAHHLSHATQVVTHDPPCPSRTSL